MRIFQVGSLSFFFVGLLFPRSLAKRLAGPNVFRTAGRDY